MMQPGIRHFWLLIAAGATLLAGGCLPDGTDPAAVDDAGKLSATYYAASLENVALQVQNAVVSDSKWFANTGASSEVNMAAQGIQQPSGLGAKVRSSVCFTGTDDAVKQIAWIDSRNADGKFSIKILGIRNGAIELALRKRLGADQVGVYEGNNIIRLSNDMTIVNPAGCSGLDIPIGAPMIVFDISRPAKPVAALSRIEYRSQSCGADGGGRPRRGTLVQKRTVTFGSDGNITPSDPNSGWQTESMGGCVDDVVVSVTNSAVAGAGAPDLNSFAVVSLKALLTQQFADMDCTKATVMMNRTTKDDTRQTTSKTINTCATVTAGGQQGFNATAGTSASDTRQIACTGSIQTSVSVPNLSGPRTGTLTWSTDAGQPNTVTLKRRVTDSTVNNGKTDYTARDSWIADTIACGGYEEITVGCDGVPVDSGVQLITGGTVVLRRTVTATSWQDAAGLVPNISAGPWQVKSSSCVWSKKETTVDCPTTYDASKQGDWVYTTGGPGFRPETKLDNPGADTPYIKRWITSDNGTSAYTTLLNTDGVDFLYKAAVSGVGLTAEETGEYRTPLLCGRDEQSPFTRPLVYLDGPYDGIYGTWQTPGDPTPLQENIYREWSANSTATGSWSKSGTVIRSTAGLGTWTTWASVPATFYVDRRYLCPSATDPSCPSGTGWLSAGGYSSDGCAQASICNACPTVTDPACPGGTLVGNAPDAHGCATAKTCQMPAVNGQCGSANGTTIPAVPTSGLCTAGTASAVGGAGPWTWTCAGSNGGSTASCSANRGCPAVKTNCGGGGAVAPAGGYVGVLSGLAGRVFAGGSIYVPGPTDANGCATQGYCRRWTFLECGTFYANGNTDPFQPIETNADGTTNPTPIAWPGCCRDFYGANECSKDEVNAMTTPTPRDKSYDDPNYMKLYYSFGAQ